MKRWPQALVVVLLVAGCTTTGGVPVAPEDEPPPQPGTSTTSTSTATSITLHPDYTTTSTSPTTTTTRPPRSTTTTAPTTTTTTQPPLVLPSGVELLMAHGNGIDLLRGTDTIPVLRGEKVEVARPDGRGGVIYQRVQEPRPEWDLTGGWWKLIWPDGVEPVPIEWLPSPGEPSRVLVPGGLTLELELTDVTDLDGRTVVIYNRLIGLEDPCDWFRANRDPTLDEDGCMWIAMNSMLWLLTARDLDSDRDWSLGIVQGWDAGAGVSVGGKRAAISQPALEPPPSIQIADIRRLTAVNELDWSIAACNGQCITVAPETRCNPDPEGRWVPEPTVTGAALSRDGSTLALVESHPACATDDGGTELVVLDIDTREELNRTTIRGDGSWIVDFDGEHVLTYSQLIVFGQQSHVIDLHPANHYSLWWDSETLGGDV